MIMMRIQEDEESAAASRPQVRPVSQPGRRGGVACLFRCCRSVPSRCCRSVPSRLMLRTPVSTGKSAAAALCAVCAAVLRPVAIWLKRGGSGCIAHAGGHTPGTWPTQEVYAQFVFLPYPYMPVQRKTAGRAIKAAWMAFGSLRRAPGPRRP